MITTVRSGDGPDRGGRPLDWRDLPAPDVRALLLVMSLAVAVFALYAALGTGWVLDDWYTLRNARFDGALAAAGPQQRSARPGAWLMYALVFGLLGDHPTAVLGLQAVIAAGTAVLLFSLLRRFLGVPIATVATVLWVVLPNHTSLEVWASAVNISLALALLLGGCLLLARSSLDAGTLLAAAALLGVGCLCYEAIAPAALVASLALPWLVAGRPDPRALAASAIALGAAGAWIVVHWHPAKEATVGGTDLTQMIPAHLGWGIVPAGVVADLVAVLGLVGVALAVARLTLPSLRASTGRPEWCVVAGLVVMVVGTLPFAFYLYAPLGAGDRFNVVSSVGGAMVWAGIVALGWTWHRAVGGVALAVLLLLGGAARVERSLLWHRAANDAVAIMDGVHEQIPEPTQTIAVGPSPIQEQNIAAFLDQSNVNAAVQLEYDEPAARGVITFSAEEFEQYPPRFRFDLRPVSRLRSDAVVEPDG